MDTVLAVDWQFRYLVQAPILAILMFWAVALISKGFINEDREIGRAQKVVGGAFFMAIWLLAFYWAAT